MKSSLKVKKYSLIIFCLLLLFPFFASPFAMETVADEESLLLNPDTHRPLALTRKNIGDRPSSSLVAELSHEMFTSTESRPAVVYRNIDEEELSSQPITYKEGQIPTNGVDSAKFMRGLDALLFEEKRSRKVYAAGVLLGVAGLVPSTPSTGALLYNVGNLVLGGSPPDSGPSDALITWYMVTSTPIFSRQFYEMGQKIMTSIAGEDSFTPLSGEDDSLPHAYKRWKTHVAVNWGVRLAAALDATFYAGVVFLSQGKEFRSVAWGTAWSVWLSFFERNESIGTRKVDRIFTYYAYDSADVREKREILLYQLLKVTLPRIASDEDLVEQIYSTVKEEKKRTALKELSLADEAVYMDRTCATTALFLKPSGGYRFEHDSDIPNDSDDDRDNALSERRPAADGGKEEVGDTFSAEMGDNNEEGGDGPQARKIKELQEVLKGLQDKLKEEGHKTKRLKESLRATEKLLRETESTNNNLIKHRALKDKMLASAKEALMEYTSVVCTGAGYLSRFLGRQYVFEAILEQVLGVSPQTASTTAWVAAAIEVLFRTGTEYDVHQDYFKGVLNSFSLSHLVDYKIVRKAASGISWINGGFVALTGAVATFMKLKQYAIPVPLQALCIVPGFILDQGSATELSREKTQNLITAAVTTEWCGCASGKQCLKSCGGGCCKKSIERKRTWCHYWVLQCVEIIKTANAATINKLSVIALDAK